METDRLGQVPRGLPQFVLSPRAAFFPPAHRGEAPV